MTTSSPIILPGLVDIHVHLRDPGQTHKETFLSGTRAALAGGFTTVFDMPNNATPVTTLDVLEAKRARASKQVVCEVGFHFGSLGENLAEFERVQPFVSGLKLYLNVTTGGYKIDADYLTNIFTAWPKGKPILLHAEADIIETALEVAEKTGQTVHVCHISCRDELEPVLAARKRGVPVTCGVTPHHLFLNEEDAKRLGNYGEVRPKLKPQADVDFLWEHFDDVDIVESDHAPHTTAEKEAGTFGFPGLETTLALMLAAEREGRVSREQIIQKLSTRPRQIIGLPEDESTHIEVDPVEFEISAEGMQSQAAWTPFAGKPGFGKVSKVVLRGTTVLEKGEIIAQPGSGFLLP